MVKIGVLGVGRGSSMMKFCNYFSHTKLVAICDKWEDGLNRKKRELKDDSITYYSSFDEFIKHDMDAVILANYATEHASFAIKCLEEGKHVLSEVLPSQTLSEAVKLIEAVEKSDKIYAYAENYCYMPATREMKKLYQQGLLGEFEYGEGEYFHNCESIWPNITYGDENHWRNRLYATFYCTHSIGPMIHITGLKPVKVAGFELPYNARMARIGCKSGHSGIEMVTLENGAVIKSCHGTGISKNSVWYTAYGSKGRMESAREDAECGDIAKLYTNLDSYDGENKQNINNYDPKDEYFEMSYGFGHGGSDFYTVLHFVEKIMGNEDADIIDVYEAMDMFLPGVFAYRSILKGGIPMDIPDFRDRAVREKYIFDNMCTDPVVAGKQVVPSYSKGNPEVPADVYKNIKEKWYKEWLEILKNDEKDSK